jgi:predicted O-methyltransferase YrrM
MKLGLGLRAKFQKARDEWLYFIKNSLGRPNLYDLNSPERVGCTYREPSDMCATDRLMLYALVRGLRPKLALEIGARWGGSARIIANAMEENGVGQLVGIDPEVENFRVPRHELHGRYILVKGYSPQDLPAATAKLNDRPIDFVFIDAMHIHDAVKADFLGVLPYLGDGAHVLFHDTFHQGVDQAICRVLHDNPLFVDCGFITRNPEVGFPVSYQGLRLVRKGAVNSERLISECYERQDKAVPPFSAQFWNYDEYYNRTKGLRTD